jgi:hypothetical protein
MILAPLISKQQAEEIFTNSSRTFFRRILRKEARPFRLELLYLPFYIFEVIFNQNDSLKTTEFSVDGLLGNVTFFAPMERNLTDCTKNQTIEFSLPLEQAEKLVLEKCKTLILEQGMKFHKDATIQSIQFSKNLYYPFWVAYFKKGKRYDFRALDGVSGEIQGIQMRKVFLKAFRG